MMKPAVEVVENEAITGTLHWRCNCTNVLERRRCGTAPLSARRRPDIYDACMAKIRQPAKRTQARSTSIATPSLVLRQFRVVFNAVRTHFRDMEKQIGLGGAQVWALSIIQAQPGIGISAVAQQMDIHQSTASNLIKGLQQRELVVMSKAVEDKRNVCLTVLPAGTAVLQSISGPFEGVLPQALGELDTETLERLHTDLQILIHLLKADESAAAIPLANL